MKSPQLAIFMVLIGSAVWLMVLLTGCKSNSAPEIRPNMERQVKNQPMTQDSLKPADPIIGAIRYVALGDSTGEGIGARDGGYVARLFTRLVARRPGSRLTNQCFSGATTADVLRDQLQSGLSEDPNLITLGIGINDVGHGVALEEFSQNYEEILSQLKSRPNVVIVVTNIPDISTAPRIPPALRTEYQRRIVDFNEKLEEIAGRYGVTLFDVYTITHQELPGHPEFFSDDGFHPSDQGYELWAERMWPTVAKAIGESTEN